MCSLPMRGLSVPDIKDEIATARQQAALVTLHRMWEFATQSAIENAADAAQLRIELREAKKVPDETGDLA